MVRNHEAQRLIEIGRRENHFARPPRRDRDTGHDDVTETGIENFRQPVARHRHKLDFQSQLRRQGVRHFDIETYQLASGVEIAVRHRAIHIAHADAPPRPYRVEHGRAVARGRQRLGRQLAQHRRPHCGRPEEFHLLNQTILIVGACAQNSQQPACRRQSSQRSGRRSQAHSAKSAPARGVNSRPRRSSRRAPSVTMYIADVSVPKRALITPVVRKS